MKAQIAPHVHRGFEYSEHACALGYAGHELQSVIHLALVGHFLFYSSVVLLGYALIGVGLRIANSITRLVRRKAVLS